MKNVWWIILIFIVIAGLGYFGYKFYLSSKQSGSQPTTQPTSQSTDNLDEEIANLYSDLHNVDSGIRAKENFTDLELVYTDEGIDNFPPEIRPFKYYYSPSANLTMSICNINRTVFICKGKLDHLLTKKDLGSCEVTQVFLESDTRLE